MNIESSKPDRFAPSLVEDEGLGAATSKQYMRVRLYAALLVLDCVAIFGAFMACGALRYGDPWRPATTNILTVLLPLYIAFAVNRRVYSSDILRHWHRAAKQSLTSLFYAVMLVLFVSFYLKASATMSREVFTTGTICAATALYLLRMGMHRLGQRLLGSEPVTQLLIRDGVEAEGEPHVITIDAAEAGLVPSLDDPRALDRIGRVLKHADRVTIACPLERRVIWAAMLKGANIHGEIVTPELADLGVLGAGRFGGEATLLVSVGPLDMRNRVLKRGLDIVFAVCTLVLLAPLMLVTAIAVKLESPGPVFFVQPRLGRGNRLFPMYKFRSMRADLCDVNGNTSTARGDSRVTKVGRIIRATSIDELPQILNVLKGEMSLVGPRPHALGSLAGDKLFWEVDPRYWHRHAAKPGITGLAQVRGFRGATHRSSDLTGRLQSDLDYLSGWTIWRDISILFATLKVVLHKNAY